MSMTCSCRARRAARLLVRACALAPALVAVSAAAHAAPVFKLADDSTTIVRGVVEGVATHKNETFYVFTIAPREVLKGATPGAALQLVEERVFGTERPYFRRGDDVLVLAVPLPAYSYYRQALPAGSYLRWTDPKESAADVGALRDPAVVAAVARYLELRGDARALARHLGTVLASAVPRLRADALATIESRRDVAAAFDVDAAAPVRGLVADEGVPVGERAAVLVRLGHAGAAGIAPLARELAAAKGPLQAAALEAAVALGEAPSEERLLALSRSEDAALRLAAVRGLTRLASRAAFERIAEVVRADPSAEVRLAALNALGTAHDPRAVDVLARAMRSSDKGEVVAASQALARIASPEAVRALAALLSDGSLDAEIAAAFALKQTDTSEGDMILRQQRDIHPEPEVRKAIKLALGEEREEHED